MRRRHPWSPCGLHHRRYSFSNCHHKRESWSSISQNYEKVNKIVILTKEIDTSYPSVKEVDIGSTIISYVPLNYVCKDIFEALKRAKNIVRVKCRQSDINVSVAVLCKPIKLDIGCTPIWSVDLRVRRRAMWSSPENEEQFYAGYKGPEVGNTLNRSVPSTSDSPISAWYCSYSPSLLRTSNSYNYSDKSNNEPAVKRYIGRVPSIVAMLTNRNYEQRNVIKNENDQTKNSLSPRYNEPSLNSFSSSPYMKYAKIARSNTRSENKQLFSDNSKKFRENNFYQDVWKIETEFHSHIYDKTRDYRSVPTRPLGNSLPPPPKAPLPPIPCKDFYYNRAYQSKNNLKPIIGSNSYDKSNNEPHLYSGHYSRPSMTEMTILSGSPSHFLQQGSHRMEESQPTDNLLTPHSDKIRRESTSVFLHDDLKKDDINQQKLSMVFVLSLFVLAVIIFYLVYFLIF